MTQLIPFDSPQLPAHLANRVAVADDLFAGGGIGFPVMSIKGKVFSIKRSGEKTIITRPDDPDTAASSVELVVLRPQKGLSKTFYLKGYTEGADGAPDCFSNDGEAPDPSIEKPQASKCAICPHNQWGSKISDAGKELKACQDNKRVAVASPGQINDPILLRVPPGSFKALNEYAKLLKSRKVDFNAVVTKVSFVMESATPQLQFKPVGYLSEEAYNEATEQYHSDVVQQIIGLIPTDEAVAPEFDEPAAAAQAPKAQPAATPAPKAAPAPKTAEPAPEIIDPVPAPVQEEAAAAVEAAKAAKPKAAKPKAEPEVTVVPEIDLDASLSAALAELNFDD